MVIADHSYQAENWGKTFLSMVLKKHNTKENIISTLLRQRKTNTAERNYWKSAFLFKCNDELLENKSNLSDGPGLEFFIANPNKKKLGINERLKKRKTPSEDHPYLKEHDLRGDGQKGI